MISKTKISKRLKRKTKPELVETIELAKKKDLLDLAKKLSGPTRKQSKVSLDKLNKLKENKLLVVGKVLGQGNIERKISIAALDFSEQAKEKLEKNGSEMQTIKQLIEKDSKLEGVKIL
jgi:large subunit ribosomal protein L18e|tara:strand:+ start:62 stop:418 length:357 start_codon:yes stop_codon:yes gene_type:complete